MGVVVDNITTPHVIILDDKLSYCIKPWQNFVKACNPYGNSVKDLYRILRQDHNATYQQTHVSFATEHDLMMFLMKWG